MFSVYRKIPKNKENVLITWYSMTDSLTYLIQKLVEASFDVYYGQQDVYDNYAYHHQIHSIDGTWKNKATKKQ